MSLSKFDANLLLAIAQPTFPLEDLCVIVRLNCPCEEFLRAHLEWRKTLKLISVMTLAGRLTGEQLAALGEAPEVVYVKLAEQLSLA